MSGACRVVGRDVVRTDAPAKVTGELKYAGDISFPGMLYAKALFSPYPHATVKRIDVERARRLEGVAYVATRSDVKGTNRLGPVKPNQPVLVGEGERVRFVGDAVALVAAVSEQIARKALKLIEVEYEELPGSFTIDESLKEGAPQIHEDSPGNICAKNEIIIGDVASGFERSDVIVEKEVFTSWQEHAYLEPEAAVATWDVDGRLVIYSCIQDPYYFAFDIGHALGFPVNRIHMVATPNGGAFGGKDDITLQAYVALLAIKTGRPVKMVYTREESIISHPKRHPFRMLVKLGATRDGKLQAMEVTSWGDAGAYAGRSPVVVSVNLNSMSGPYFIPNVKLTGFAVYTNNVVTGACRGYGQPQANVAREVTLDLLARRLSIDPVELRRLNSLKLGDSAGTRLVKIDSPVSLGQTIDVAMAQAGDKPGPSSADRRVGRGISCVMPLFDVAALPSAGLAGTGVSLELHADGSISVRSMAVELGQGVQTVLAQIAAEEFGVEVGVVRVTLGDTDLAPKSGPTVASRSTYTAGNALRVAAKSLKERLLEVASRSLDVPSEKLEFMDGKVCSTGDRGKALTLARLAELCYQSGISLKVESWFKADHALIGHTFMTTVCDVEVDTRTGDVRVLNLVTVHDTGKVVNPAGVRGQLNGGGIQAMGWALMEEFISERGLVSTPSLAEYLIPTSLDLPDSLVSVAIEEPYPTGPFGAKGIGEHATMSVAPAILNAINDATGLELSSIPVTSERLAAAMGLL